ncbi:MAG TPA: MgtC/SapB family protein [Thermoprotei archaeon]|nr:MgtC/SapB family protein [Thermoprotei archaeon]
MVETASIEIEIIEKVLIAAILGGIIGLEREVRHKPAGFRTHILVCMGSALFTSLSYIAFPGSDPSRIASYVVAGIGFIGAGVILRRGAMVVGLTTAATLWIVTAIGMAVGVGFYITAVVTSVLTFIILNLKLFEKMDSKGLENVGKNEA